MERFSATSWLFLDDESVDRSERGREGERRGRGREMERREMADRVGKEREEFCVAM